ncbi:DUF4435 domain-containing protein [Streptomyces sp. NBC_00243]|uniref:DUF4435 domain-containing protein n=1 Tax=Streptomyces sp. NBC_00243 TaxID=2975688 RepID=UPI002DD8DE98|nr:DUF4435 domain-containing protein [Streptomyces sp. NBC_00243]WRZ21345.1 DUF4435 domain-containing protein [Streptomyces sp. NBC_00243]
MRNLLTGSDIYSHILILRGSSARKSSYIIVEGDDDCGLIDPHVDSTNCETIPSGGKAAVSEAVGIARSQGLHEVAAVLDMDWVDILYPRSTIPSVFYTDSYDIDAMAFSRAQNIEGFISNFCNKEKVAAYRSLLGQKKIDDVVIEIAAPIGVLRYLSEKNSWGLSLRDFPVHAVLDSDARSTDINQLIIVAMGRSKGASISAQQVENALRIEIARVQNLFRYCSGHDLLAALAAVCRKKLGGKVNQKVVGAALRTAFSCRDANSSQLFNTLGSWGDSLGVQVLNCHAHSQ